MSQPANFQTNKNVSEIARRTGVSITTVSRKLASGKTEEDIVREADEYRAKQERQTRTMAGQGETFHEAERRKQVALADLKELELAEKRGEFVPVAEVNLWISSMILSARGILLRIAPELADRLSQETNPSRVRSTIDAEVYRALTALSEFRK